MPYIVVEPCVKCRYTDCAEACPVDDCFKLGANFMVIDPDTCIDCGACEPACPVNACLPEDEVPEKWQAYVELNKKYAAQWPGLNRNIGPLDSAEEFKDVENKLDMIDASPGDPG